MKASHLITLVLGLSGSAALAQTPGASLDESWVRVCASAQPGSAFAARCAEIIAAGPGSADRRSEAADGNNLGTLAAQLRGSDSARSEQGEAGVDGVRLREDFGRVGLFFSGHSARSRRDASEFENRWRGRDRGALAGLDYRLRADLVMGVSLNAGSQTLRFDNDAGRTEIERRGVTGFATWMASEHFTLDAYLGYTSTDYDIDRAIRYNIVLNAGEPEQSEVSINALAQGRTDGRQHLGGLGAHYSESQGRWALGGSTRLDWMRSRVDAYSETGGGGLGQRFEAQRSDSLTASIGGSVGYNLSQGWGVLTPQASMRWIREFDQDARDIRSRFLGDSAGSVLQFSTEAPDRSFGEFGLGLVGTFAGGGSAFFHYRRLVGHSLHENANYTLGLRFEL